VFHLLSKIDQHDAVLLDDADEQEGRRSNWKVTAERLRRCSATCAVSLDLPKARMPKT
jgi:hypothetical protein